MADPISGPQTKKVRKALILSQEAWARRLGVRRVTTISRWENGKSNPEERFWGKIRRAAREAGLTL